MSKQLLLLVIRKQIQIVEFAKHGISLCCIGDGVGCHMIFVIH